MRIRAIGLILRGVGESHVSAHALGLPVLKVRWLAVLFGGLCAGWRGLSVADLHPVLVAGHDSGARLDRAGAGGVRGGRVWRLVAGAYLFGAILIAQLHAQAGAIGIPSQFLSMLPYLMTILALIVLSIGRAARGGGSRIARTALRAGAMTHRILPCLCTLDHAGAAGTERNGRLV
jgi:ABC-type uncharacterized transport system permease subunit